VAVAGEQVLVGAAHGAGKHAVAHWAAVDEQVLRLGAAAVQRRQAGVAGEHDAVALGVDGDGVFGKLPSHHGAQPGERRAVAGLGLIAQNSTTSAGEREGDLGMGHGEAFDGVGDVGGLRALRLEKLEARWSRKK